MRLITGVLVIVFVATGFMGCKKDEVPAPHNTVKQVMTTGTGDENPPVPPGKTKIKS